MVNKDKLIKDVIKVISNNFGDTIAGYYKTYYQKKSPQLILKSCQIILADLVGPRNAQKKIMKISEKYGLLQDE